MSACQSCEAEIIWVFTVSGARMPIDADPVRDGNVVWEDGRARVLKRGEEPPGGTPRYRSHFMTCPHAATYRKPAPAAPPTLF